ncbi:hypothetical protein ACI68E_003467 [Malassezia pachydermatis]
MSESASPDEYASPLPEEVEDVPAATGDDFDDDFGDFEEGEDAAEAVNEDDSPATPSAPTMTSEALSVETLSCLSIHPDPNDLDMRKGLRALLPMDFVDLKAPVEAPVEDNVVMEGMRQVEGLSQILVTEASRSLLRELQVDHISSAPLDWRRSHTRRQYLISLGVPINLDEVHGSGWASKETLPPLELKLTPSAKEAQPTPSAEGSTSTSDETRTPPVTQHESWGDRRRRELGLTEPHVPMHRIEAVLQLSEDDIKLQTLPELRELVKEMQVLSTQLGEALQYHLTIREAFASDSEVFNGMIRDLVAGASNKISEKMKAEKRSFISRATKRSTMSESSSRPSTPGSR